jgi:hypothetical protein
MPVCRNSSVLKTGKGDGEGTGSRIMQSWQVEAAAIVGTLKIPGPGDSLFESSGEMNQIFQTPARRLSAV